MYKRQLLLLLLLLHLDHVLVLDLQLLVLQIALLEQLLQLLDLLFAGKEAGLAVSHARRVMRLVQLLIAVVRPLALPVATADVH